jgi:hypothetical protein
MFDYLCFLEHRNFGYLPEINARLLGLVIYFGINYMHARNIFTWPILSLHVP